MGDGKIHRISLDLVGMPLPCYISEMVTPILGPGMCQTSSRPGRQATFWVELPLSLNIETKQSATLESQIGINGL